MLDPDSPMPAIFALYASRPILKPGQIIEKPRSTPGVPKRKQRHSDLEYYMFDELLSVDKAAPPPSVSPAPSCSTAPDEDTPEAAPEPVVAIEDVIVPAPVDQVIDAGDDEANGFDAWDVSAELALIGAMDDRKLGILRQAAESILDGETDWKYDLDFELGRGGTTGEIIERIEGAAECSAAMRNFLLAARTGGISAGREAYRQTIIRQHMILIGTDPRWSTERRMMGLE
jgi:hypothetical protein